MLQGNSQFLLLHAARSTLEARVPASFVRPACPLSSTLSTEGLEAQVESLCQDPGCKGPLRSAHSTPRAWGHRSPTHPSQAMSTCHLSCPRPTLSSQITWSL